MMGERRALRGRWGWRSGSVEEKYVSDKEALFVPGEMWSVDEVVGRTGEEERVR
jgi:hypothetical protein